MLHCAIVSEMPSAAGSDYFYEHEGNDRGDCTCRVPTQNNIVGTLQKRCPISFRMILTAEGAEGAEEEKREERTFLWVGAGLFDLSATFISVGEPAPTAFGEWWKI